DANALDEVSDAIGDDACFAAACAGKDEERPVYRFHGVALLRIELVEEGQGVKNAVPCKVRNPMVTISRGQQCSASCAALRSLRLKPRRHCLDWSYDAPASERRKIDSPARKCWVRA